MLASPETASSSGSHIGHWMNGLNSDIGLETKFDGWQSVILGPDRSLWVPFGWVIVVLPLSDKRPVLIDGEADKGVVKKQGKRQSQKLKEKPAEKEWGTTVWFPCLRKADCSDAPGSAVCEVRARLEAAKLQWPKNLHSCTEWQSWMKWLGESKDRLSAVRQFVKSPSEDDSEE